MWGEDTLQFELTSGGGRKALHPDRRAAPAYCGAEREWNECHDRLAGLEPASDGWERRFPVYSVAVESALGPQEGPPTG